jgi:hypothetical protein
MWRGGVRSDTSVAAPFVWRCLMPPPLPRCSGWVYSSLNLTHPYQPSPVRLPGRRAHRPFRGLLGVHSRCGLHSRAVTYMWPLSEGFRHFVTSMPAPVASGWSGCRAGLAPVGEAPPCHGARRKLSLSRLLRYHRVVESNQTIKASASAGRLLNKQRVSHPKQLC